MTQKQKNTLQAASAVASFQLQMNPVQMLHIALSSTDKM